MRNDMSERTESHLVSMTSGGLAKLSDGSVWRIAPDHLPRTRAWVAGTYLRVEPQPEHPRYRHRLTDAAGIAVSAVAGQDLERPWPHLGRKV